MSKWHRSIVAVTLVAAFAAGTVAVSGGYKEFTLGEVGGNPLQGVAATLVPPQAAVTTFRIAVAAVGAIWPFRPHLDPASSGSLLIGELDETIFD